MAEREGGAPGTCKEPSELPSCHPPPSLSTFFLLVSGFFESQVIPGVHQKETLGLFKKNPYKVRQPGKATPPSTAKAPRCAAAGCAVRGHVSPCPGQEQWEKRPDKVKVL